MPEILFLTNKQGLLETIEQLKTLEAARIVIVNDFAQGLKEIFFRQPAVVFIQEEIGGISGEKVACQVRMLLDETPIRLVLLHNQTAENQGISSHFDGGIDISVPPEELMRLLQQQVNNALYPEQGMTASSGETTQNDMETVELSINPPDPIDLYTIDSLADIFPAHLPDDWAAPLPAAEQGEQSAAYTFESSIEPIKPGEEFTFDSISDISLGNPPGIINSPFSPVSDISEASPRIESLPGHETAEDIEPLDKDVRPDDQEAQPRLSVGSADDTCQYVDLLDSDIAISAIGIERGGGPEPAKTFVDTSNISDVKSSPSKDIPGDSEKSPATFDKAPSLPHVAQNKALPLIDEATLVPAATVSEHFNTIFPDEAFVDKIPFRKNFDKKSSFTPKVLIGLLILIIIIATFFLVQDWFGTFSLDKTVSIASPPTPLRAPVMYLPKFIPDVMPDRAYAVSHPGWERREADGLEYLIYRENSRIRAIQVIAETQGVISVPFLKTCIREISGREDADSWVLEKRDDIVVAKGALRNKGEMVLYRKMPEGDIRGFVLSFY